MHWLTTYLAGGLAILILMTALWLLSVRLKDASLVDSFWGPGFAVAAFTYFALGEGFGPRKLIVLSLVLVWGLRLGWHLFRRNHGRGEDFRYQAWRKQVGAAFWWVSFFQVYLLQGAVLWLISAPLMATQASAVPATLTLFDGLGLLVWGVGFSFEVIGDTQLARFKANPVNQGRVLDSGLWRYTRHPNYFGDACLWWGYWLLAVSVPWGWVTIFAPILMTFLLRRVSGVVLLEKTLATRPGYSAYIERTPAFFPWFPKNK